MANTQTHKHYEFTHLLRGIAALTVALLAHLIGIAWLSPQVMTTLLHVNEIAAKWLLYQLIYINNVNGTVALPLTLIIVFALAHSIHKLVELPSNLYGKRIAAKLNNLKNTEAYLFVHKAFRLPLN